MQQHGLPGNSPSPHIDVGKSFVSSLRRHRGLSLALFSLQPISPLLPASLGRYIGGLRQPPATRLREAAQTSGL
jgi:hypothetical protein